MLAPTLKELKHKIELEITRVCNWIQANKLTINPAKSNALFINPKKNDPVTFPSIKTPVDLIKSVSKAKCLRIIL